MHVCMYVCMCVMYVCMYACMCVCMCVCVCVYVCMWCMYVCMHVCMYVTEVSNAFLLTEVFALASGGTKVVPIRESHIITPYCRPKCIYGIQK